MPPPPKAAAVSAQLRECLALIKTGNGYLTELAKAYAPNDRVPDTAPKPYALIRPSLDGRTGLAGYEATRLRTYEIEVIFAKSADEAELSAVHVDVLRALGIGQDLPERKLPGLLEEQDEASFRWAQAGETTHSITITIGVTYVERYN